MDLARGLQRFTRCPSALGMAVGVGGRRRCRRARRWLHPREEGARHADHRLRHPWPRAPPRVIDVDVVAPAPWMPRSEH
eukprot:8934125-Pyramimonas_sp.AAC.1